MSAFPSFADLVASGQTVKECRPWTRAVLNGEQWHALGSQLASGRWTLVSLWGEADCVHAAVRDGNSREIPVFTIPSTDASFPSLARSHPPATRLERAVEDLFGLTPRGAADTRPWLDHGRWPVKHPLGDIVHAPKPMAPYSFLPAEGEGLHAIPVGPVHAGIIEPGHFRFSVNGEAVVRLEERLGYAHKGVDMLMRGRSTLDARRLAGRVSGDSTVAYALAFSRAIEAACDIGVPPRAHVVRAVMAELERLANHCGDIGAICNDATFTIMHAHCAILREHVLRTADACFGHRLMMDRVVPGGVTADLTPQGISALHTLIDMFRRRFPRLVGLYDNTASLQDRTVTTGVVRKALAAQYGAGGYVGRASGLTFDARKAMAYPPYDALSFDVPVFEEGDVNARVWVRIREIEQSLKLIEQLIEGLPDGPTAVEPRGDGTSAEGAAMVEGFRGDIFAWVRVGDDGLVDRCHLRDPSWFQWPLLEAAIEGNIVADFPLCNKSFNCSYSGHDL